MAFLKEQRTKKNLTMRQVCDAVDISEGYYSMIESGERRPSVETAKKIAAVLGFDWTQFFPDEKGE